MEGALPDRAGRLTLPALAAVAALAWAGCGSAAEERRERPEPVLDEASKPSSPGESRDLRSRPKAVQLEGAGGQPDVRGDPLASAPSPGAQSDAEVRAELRAARAALSDFKQYLSTTAFLQTGPRARVLPDGSAIAPSNAPDVVKRVILAGNQIARFPYKWGGGHGAWRDTGYDCSGSVSFALAAAGMVDRPLTSGGFIDWGTPGPGEWITIYTNSGHIFMIVAGLRFDTSGRGRLGTRWQDAPRGTAGFAVRHYPGL